MQQICEEVIIELALDIEQNIYLFTFHVFGTMKTERSGT